MLLGRYLAELSGDDGASDGEHSFAYRGQSSAAWPLQSSAYRRLSRSAPSAGGNNAVPEDRLIEYSTSLISDFRNRRFDTADGVRLTDIEALALLQHLGAATPLIDFTLSPLIALWFACQDAPPDPDAPTTSQQDGMVFIVDTTYGLDNDPGSGFDELLDRLIPPHDLLAWEPPVATGARERVVAQRSVLLFGRPLMASNLGDCRLREIRVPCADKKQLRQELASMGIDATSLFPDLHGFASANGVGQPALKPSAKNLLDQGVSAYNQGTADEAHYHLARYMRQRPDDWTARLLLSNVFVDLKRYDEALEILDAAEQHIGSIHWVQHHTFYANRANVKAAKGDHRGAVGDYDRALELPLASEQAIRYNRGNSHFALGEYESALADFEAWAGNAHAAHNAGNTCIALGSLGRAKEKYQEAAAEPGGSGNRLNNLRAVESIMALIGADQCEVEARPFLAPPCARRLGRDPLRPAQRRPMLLSHRRERREHRQHRMGGIRRGRRRHRVVRPRRGRLSGIGRNVRRGHQ